MDVWYVCCIYSEQSVLILYAVGPARALTLTHFYMKLSFISCLGAKIIATRLWTSVDVWSLYFVSDLECNFKPDTGFLIFLVQNWNI